MRRRLLTSLAIPAAALILTPLGMSQAKDAQDYNKASSSPSQLLTNWQADYGSSWKMRNNRRTGTMELLYGGKANAGLEPNINQDNDWFELTRFWVNQTFAMHGVYNQDLVNERVVFLPLAKSNTTDKMTVALVQGINGIPVEDAKVNALFTLSGELLSLHSTGAPSVVSRSTTPRVSEEFAISTAMETFAAEEKAEPLSVGHGHLVFAYVDDQEVRRWTLAWQVDVQNTKTADKPVGYLYTIDRTNRSGPKTRSFRALP